MKTSRRKGDVARRFVKKEEEKDLGEETKKQGMGLKGNR